MKNFLSLVFCFVLFSCSKNSENISPTSSQDQPEKNIATTKFYSLLDTVKYNFLPSYQNQYQRTLLGRTQALDFQNCDSITIEWTSNLSYSYDTTSVTGLSVELWTAELLYYEKQTKNIQTFSQTFNQFQIINKDSVVFKFYIYNGIANSSIYSTILTKFFGLKVIAWK